MAEEVTAHNISLTATGDNNDEKSLSVEKIAKSLGGKFSQHPDINWFSIRVENLAEGFSTFAALEWPEN